MAEFNPTLTADIYRSILHLGLENLQRYRIVESFDYLAIEIDHLHNIPKYIVADSLISHGYYYCGERDFYIERLADIPVIETDFLIRMYQPHWDALRDALLPYAEAINARNWPTKLQCSGRTTWFLRQAFGTPSMFGDTDWHWYNFSQFGLACFVQGGVVKTFRQPPLA